MNGKPGDQPAGLAWFDSTDASPEEAAAARSSLEEAVKIWTTEKAVIRDEVQRILTELESKLTPHIQKMFQAGGHDYEAMKKQSADYFALIEKGLQKDSDLSPQALSPWDQNVLSAAEDDITAARKAIAHALTSARTSTLAWPGLVVFEHREGTEAGGTVAIEQSHEEKAQ